VRRDGEWFGFGMVVVLLLLEWICRTLKVRRERTWPQRAVCGRFEVDGYAQGYTVSI
jgi:hypothetical protein